MAEAFGTPCTAKALRHRMEHVNRDVQAIKNALKDGIDPATLILGGRGSGKTH